MKVTKLTVKNIGIIEKSCIEINKPEIVFYGEIKQGKSTLLNAVRWVCGGSVPGDIIRHGQTEASVMLEGTESDGKPWMIQRGWYIGKDGTTKAREVVYTRGGVPVKKPVQEIAKHLNPFLLDQDHLRKMTTLERGRYLAELFGVKTDAEDATIAAADQQAKQLRIKIGMYGALDLTPVERVDVAKLQADRRDIVSEYEAECAHIDAENEAIRKYNSEVARIESGCMTLAASITRLEAEIKRLEAQLTEYRAKASKGTAWLAKNKKLTEAPRPAQPDTAAVDAALQQAGAQNVRADNYDKARMKAEEKAADEKALLAQENIIRDAKAVKVAMLAKVGKESGVPGLVFTATGFEFDGTDSSMLSDSQVMRLSDALSAKYPEGFGLSMIDRGESLGKSVLTLWEEAQARKATVLVTVVGDKPAEIPEQVGAYVVSKGKVTA